MQSGVSRKPCLTPLLVLYWCCTGALLVLCCALLFNCIWAWSWNRADDKLYNIEPDHFTGALLLTAALLQMGMELE